MNGDDILTNLRNDTVGSRLGIAVCVVCGAGNFALIWVAVRCLWSH